MRPLRLAVVLVLMAGTVVALCMNAPGWVYWPTFAGAFAAAVWWETGLIRRAAR
ncbi:hypothetical protein Sme01_03690 [Sphaerisporangium melleum]|uniref:Uncharacterized protein n=1 Tax=Sphaerisporangium melleum TaxID=321316 RepID=A0A917QQA2_9ACTN|nr:hypothetical protein [Sphaerisporangium melleum]GGK61828.1 hypothetical protein GCM10007964_01240 [Sphaerisporangium melleum]GII67893.1 hypothetical protein Sme01_03690 [Sphaerisporangium melleum]